MARPIPLADALQGEKDVLFDACILINLARENGMGPLTDAFYRIPVNLRLVIDLVRWELIQDAAVDRATRARRRAWVEDRKNIIFPYRRFPAGYFDTLTAIMGMTDARGSGVDAKLAALAIAGRMPIATDNLRDFCWHPGIFVIQEFVNPNNQTRFDCSNV